MQVCDTEPHGVWAYETFGGVDGGAGIKGCMGEKKQRAQAETQVSKPVPQLLSLCALEPVHHNYWVYALEPASYNYWAREPQLLKPVRLEPVLRNKRSHRNEKPTHCDEE